MTKDAPGMRGIRSRNESGELREKRGDTHVKTITYIRQILLFCRLGNFPLFQQHITRATIADTRGHDLDSGPLMNNGV